MNEHPKREISTFHSGKYLFSAVSQQDIAPLADAVSVISALPMTEADRQPLTRSLTERAVFGVLFPDEKGITFDQVSRIIQHDRSNFTQDVRSIETVNVHCALKYALEHSGEPLTPELLASVNAELGRNLVSKEAEGLFRKGSSKPDDPSDYTPPFTAIDINLLLKNLTEWLTSKEMSNVNPFIKGMLLHMHLKKIRPFAAFNCRTARIAEIMLLRAHGISVPAMMIPDICVKDKTAYFNAVTDFCSTSDITSYARFICSGLLRLFSPAAVKNRELFGRNSVMEYLNRLLDKKELIPRQHAFLSMLYETGKSFSQEELQLKKPFTKYYAKVSRTTASRDVRKFMDMGLIRPVENGYVFNRELLSF
ncbi:MAG: Fic family protein [Deferribacterales bacterium]